MSRNNYDDVREEWGRVAPREGRVSRNHVVVLIVRIRVSRAPRGACE